MLQPLNAQGFQESACLVLSGITSTLQLNLYPSMTPNLQDIQHI